VTARSSGISIMPPTRVGDIDASEHIISRRSSRKIYLDELPVDACASPSSHGGQDRDHDHISVRPSRSRRLVGLSKRNIVITPHLKQRGKLKSRNPASQSLAKPIALKGIVLQPTVVFDTFWRFAAERKAVDDRRRAGLPQP
jgi:hypothetical protein